MMNRPDTLMAPIQAHPTDSSAVGSMDRRRFFSLLGGGICFAVLVGTPGSQAADAALRFAAGKRNPPQVGAWIHIGENGLVTIYTGKVELGQNIRTSLAQAVAEELPLALDSIHLVMGDTWLTPYDVGTFGSLTTLQMSPQLRRAAAAARQLLMELAAKEWGVNPATLEAKEGQIVHPTSNRRIAYADLAKGKEWLEEIPAETSMKHPQTWTVSGKSIPKIGGEAFVTGRHRYASDLKLPGMLYGVILRPPTFGAKLRSVNTEAAKALLGVVVVRDGDLIGVCAPTEFAAREALDSIQAEWEPVPHPSDQELVEILRKTGVDREEMVQQDGELQTALSQAKTQHTASYTAAYIAHTPLEPRSALAVWEEGVVTVWTGTQRPFGVQEELMRALELPYEKVRVMIPDTGSGYGGKHTGETAIEAARLAKGAGCPVNVRWTRQEEFTWAYCRPAGVFDLRAGLSEDGKVIAWDFHGYNIGTAGIRHTYDFPNQEIKHHRSDSPLRQGSYRCLGATTNNFARESFIDELAHLAKMDPLAFRLHNTSNKRYRACLQAAAERFGWGTWKATPERSYGMAGGFEKNGYNVTCVEITIEPDTGKIEVVRVVMAFDNGPVVNPAHMENQIEGMVSMGLGGALFEEIRFQDGKITNARLSRYRVPRFRDMPAVECVLMNPQDEPLAGGGENPIISIAPAIGNAVFLATGKRLRHMPLKLTV
ncbi:MAG: molybdopterin-dependent oxidoreductase [bacterium]|jgi:isoquinoline 1-oxidoreductase|nr:molybdopterin-dependent oxidoreductase [bacterium]